MANFLKGPGMSNEGYDRGINRQILQIGKSSPIALWGGGPGNDRLVVNLNDPKIGVVVEKGQLDAATRTFDLVARSAGHAMVEAKASDGSVWAFMQLEVRGGQAVAAMSMNEKLDVVIRRSQAHMPAEMWNQVKQLLEPASLAIMAGVTLAWAGSHFFGVGEIADVVLVVAGGVVLGLSAIEVGREIYAFAVGTKKAQNEADLEEASKHFARAVVLGGITIVSAMFFKSRPKTFKEPFFGGPVKVPVGPRGPGILYEATEVLAPIKSPPGVIIRGTTDQFGNITVEIRQSAAMIRQTLLHERVHAFLTPRLYFMRRIRIKVAMEGYNRSYLLRYLEEALAETYALVRTEGMGSVVEGLKFPVQNGYVTVVSMTREATGILIGTIVVGGTTYRVLAQLSGS
ncbi:MAG TPA: hypothetical protein VFH73_06895 [Polyangia bacterium]|jgi:hypothetical protein|nr:hypothetical protein [Polyangia bacterium]